MRISDWSSDVCSSDLMAARFSEHGFALLCHGVNHDRTQALADKIRHAFSDHIIEAGDRSVSVTVSIGGVQIGERIASLNQVLTKASQCLQSEQAEGGNRKQIGSTSCRGRVGQCVLTSGVAGEIQKKKI